MIFTENNHLVKGLDPVADAFAGTVYSDVVNMQNFGQAIFVIIKGVGATGTSTVTVEACDDTSGSNVTAIPFRYVAVLSGDTTGTLTDATTSGFTTTAGSSQRYVVMADAEAMAGTDYSYLRLKCVEVVDSPVLGGIETWLSEPRHASKSIATAIV